MNLILNKVLILIIYFNISFICYTKKIKNGHYFFNPYMKNINKNDFNTLKNNIENKKINPFFINLKIQYKRINVSDKSQIRSAHNVYFNNQKKIINNLTKKIDNFILYNSNNLKTFEDDIDESNIQDTNQKTIVDDISNNINENVNDSLLDISKNINQNHSNKNVLNNLNIKKESLVKNLFETGKTLSLLSLWYTCNILYNIENKKALNILNLPITISIIQLSLGIPIFLIPWLLKIKKYPKFYSEDLDNKDDIKIFKKIKNFFITYNSIIKQSLCYGYVHLLSVIGMSLGSISFVHIIKALEPIFASTFSFFLLNNRMSIYTYLSLLPIIFGVSLASIKELSFSYKALYYTLIANVFSSLKNIEAKKMMSKNLNLLGQNLTPSNIFALITIFATIYLLPALFLDVFKWKDSYYYLINNNINIKILAKHILMSGLWFYLYNELSFIALHRLNNISHAVANTVKRVFLILTSFFIFKTKFSLLGITGSSIAVFGTMLYSLSKQKFG